MSELLSSDILLDHPLVVYPLSGFQFQRRKLACWPSQEPKQPVEYKLSTRKDPAPKLELNSHMP